MGHLREYSPRTTVACRDEPALPDLKTSIHDQKILCVFSRIVDFYHELFFYDYDPALAKILRKNVILLHDTARSHNSKSDFRKKFELGYFTTSFLLLFLKGKTFNSVEKTTQAVENFFQSKPAAFYKGGIHKLPERLEKVTDNSGEYVIN